MLGKMTRAVKAVWVCRVVEPITSDKNVYV